MTLALGSPLGCCPRASPSDGPEVRDARLERWGPHGQRAFLQTWALSSRVEAAGREGKGRRRGRGRERQRRDQTAAKEGDRERRRRREPLDPAIPDLRPRAFQVCESVGADPSMASCGRCHSQAGASGQHPAVSPVAVRGSSLERPRPGRREMKPPFAVQSGQSEA